MVQKLATVSSRTADRELSRTSSLSAVNQELTAFPCLSFKADKMAFCSKLCGLNVGTVLMKKAIFEKVGLLTSLQLAVHLQG